MQKKHIPFCIWVIWSLTWLCFYYPVLRYSYFYSEYAGSVCLSSVIFIVAGTCLAPLTFRAGLKIMRRISDNPFSFFIKKAGKKGRCIIHLSPYADTRTHEEISKHWSILIELISNAMTHHETIIMQSHLLTPARIKKLKNKLESHGVFTSFKVYRRKTTINEKLSVPLIYLLLHWSLPLLPSESSIVIISAK
ncbi:hypothetical protein F8W75_20190 [Salmonella enterica]|nr:hypothetical protein [Salmonella enterica]